MQNLVEELQTEGYTIVRGFLSPSEIVDVAAEVDKMYAEGLKHHATYRDKNTGSGQPRRRPLLLVVASVSLLVEISPIASNVASC